MGFILVLRLVHPADIAAASFRPATAPHISQEIGLR
jgi:hypothetical protein